MTDRVYLDWNATAPLRPEARAVMIGAMDAVGNPSSVHGEGVRPKSIVEKARAQVAELAGCTANEVIFTSGATEAAALAIPENATMASSGIEHDAVLAWVQSDGVDLRQLLDVDSDGVFSGTAQGDTFENKIWDDVVALQAANGETGVLQSTLRHAEKLWALKRNVLIVVDAVQALGKTKFSIATSGADFVLASAHKLGGPKGVGALIVKPGLTVGARLKGGGQEQGRRSGTENVIGIAGFGAAAEAAGQELKSGTWDRVAEMRDMMEAAIATERDDTTFVGQNVPRLPNTSCLMSPGWKGETQVMQMDLAGFAISAGSACSSGKVRPSHVLKAMGYDDLASSSAIRVSLGPTTTKENVLRFVDAFVAAQRKYRRKAA